MTKNVKQFALLAVTILMLISVIAGCTPAGQATENKSSQAQSSYSTRFKIATTTSLNDTGLWDYLTPVFEKKFNTALDVVAAGTGAALDYGKRGDVDAVTVHDPAAEAQFISDGYGINKRSFAFNYFIVVGPAADPAAINGLSPEDAFKKIYAGGTADPTKVKFVSRGDNSGTYAKEKLIWQAAGFNYPDVEKSGKWYIEAGKGMGPSLVMASEQGAYILTDISTFLAYGSKLNLVPIVESGQIFLNVYDAIAINPAKVTTAKMLPMANNFINWLISDDVQNLIATYGVDKYGKPLFSPMKGGGCKDPGCPKVEDYTVPVS
jgi:tungstate transport system substrate-binding protein